MLSRISWIGWVGVLMCACGGGTDEAASPEPTPSPDAATTADDVETDPRDPTAVPPTASDPMDADPPAAGDSGETPGAEAGSEPAMPPTEAGTDPAASDDDGSAPPSTGECRPDRTRATPGGHTVDVGEFCDVVNVCSSEQQTAEVTELAPDFDCTSDRTEFSCPEYSCQMQPSAQDRRLIQTEMDQICALSTLALDAGAIECRVYL